MSGKRIEEVFWVSSTVKSWIRITRSSCDRLITWRLICDHADLKCYVHEHELFPISHSYLHLKASPRTAGSSFNATLASAWLPVCFFFFLWRSESPFCWGRETPLTQVVEFLYFLNELNPSRSPEEPLSPQTWNTPWCIHWHQLTTFFSGLQSTADHLLTNSDHRSHLTDLTLSDYPDRALNWIRWPWTHCSEMKPHLSPSGMWQSGSSQVGWRPLGSSLWCCQKTCFID